LKRTLAIASRELGGILATPLGWLILVCFVGITGLFFALMLTDFSVQSTQMAVGPQMAESFNLNDYVLPAFFSNWAVILLFICPAISMRTFAEDIGQRSFELLLSSPLTSTQIVLGKFLGSLGFLAMLFASSLHFVVIFNWLGTPDPGVLAASYLTMFLMSACFLAVGMLASAFTVNQVVAYILTFATLLGLWVLSWSEGLAGPEIGPLLAHVSVLSHMEQLIKGLMHLDDLVYFGSFVAFFLFATIQRVESMRWR
jgi:ABC-2 type transport system permease protein